MLIHYQFEDKTQRINCPGQTAWLVQADCRNNTIKFGASKQIEAPTIFGHHYGTLD